MQMNYETFVRMAFGFGTTGRMLDRWGDPAGLANTDRFNSAYIAEVKAATAYSMEIMSNAVHNHVTSMSDAESLRLDNFTKQIINAPSLQVIDGLITEYRDTVVDVYFTIDEGNVVLK